MEVVLALTALIGVAWRASPITAALAEGMTSVSAVPQAPVPKTGYLVAQGDTLAEIARRLRANSAGDLYQIMVAIYRTNPDSFGGNMNNLLQGAWLRIPGPAEIAALDHNEAMNEVRRQTEAWRAAGGTHLRLVTPSESGGESGGGDWASVPRSEAQALEAQALKDRAKDLEAQLAASRRLIDIRNSELSALQRKLGVSPTTPTGAPTPDEKVPPAQTTPAPPAAAPPTPTPLPPAAESTPHPAPVVASSPTPESFPVDIKLGILPVGSAAVTAPRKVTQYQSFNVSLRLARGELAPLLADTTSAAPPGTAVAGISGVRMSPRMKAELIGDDFIVEGNESKQVQLVTEREDTTWEWRVHSDTVGSHLLTVRIDTLLIVEGAEAPRIIDVADVNIAVKVDAIEWAIRHWEWIGSGLVIPGVGWFLKRRFGDSKKDPA